MEADEFRNFSKKKKTWQKFHAQSFRWCRGQSSLVGQSSSEGGYHVIKETCSKKKSLDEEMAKFFLIIELKLDFVVKTYSYLETDNDNMGRGPVIQLNSNVIFSRILPLVYNNIFARILHCW